MHGASSASSLVEDLDGAGAVLVLASGMDATREEACRALLSGDRAVGVVYRESANEWRDRTGETTVARVVDAGGAGEGEDAVALDTPEDLTGIEIAVTDALGQEGTTLCFDSLTALLQYVELERAYRFLHALVEHLWMADVRAHFHVDPAAHDDRTIEKLKGLMDAVVTVTEDGMTVQRRPVGLEPPAEG